MKRLIIVGLMLTLSSCAHFRAPLKNKTDVLKNWGYPDKKAGTKDKEVYIYYTSKTTSGYMGNGFTHTSTKKCQHILEFEGELYVNYYKVCN